MLKKLYLQNIILIRQATLEFSAKLNIITGETGSGKTAILSAIKQLVGAKTENGLIQEGKLVGIVEGHFILPSDNRIWALLKEEGITFEKETPLVVRKELSRKHKSRAFINDQLVSTIFLKKIGGFFLEILSPSSYMDLFSQNLQRSFLDQFGDIDLNTFQDVYKQKCQLEKELLEMQTKNPEKERDVVSEKIKEIEEVGFAEGEEEELNKEHNILSHTEKLLDLTKNVEELLYDKPDSVTYQLSLIKKNLISLLAVDPSFQERVKLADEAYLNLDELSHTIRNYRSKLEPRPQRLSEIETRFCQIDRLKKRYGKDFDEVQKTYSSLKDSFEKLSLWQETLEEKKEEFFQKKKQCIELSEKISESRKRASKFFEKKVVSFLKELNIPYPKFIVSIEKEEMSNTGTDNISYLFSANRGVLEKPIKDCASTGELARVLLSIKTFLANKEDRMIIFDEIDANVGGKTASLIGKKLSEISQVKQVICITHFVQVAKYGDLHFQVEKQEDRGLAKTLIKVLQDHATEFFRMVGE